MGVKIHYDNKEKFYDFAPIPAPEMDGENGVPIEVSVLPEPTEDILGKVYFNTTDGEYYVCSEDSDFKVGQPLGDKIYFDTSKAPNLYHVPFDSDHIILMATKDGDLSNAVGVLLTGLMDENSPHARCYIMIEGRQTAETISGSLVYADSDIMTVDEFNEIFGEAAPELGVTQWSPLSKFGWQTDMLDTSEFADCIVTYNHSPAYGYPTRTNKKLVMKKLNKFDDFIEDNITHLVSNVERIEERSCECMFNLESAVFPNASSIGSLAFHRCDFLTKLVIGTNQTTIATIDDSVDNPFVRCCHILGVYYYDPDGGGQVYDVGIKDGYIYVPATLVADYRVAENWSTYASQIMPYVATLEELANIDGTTYDKACVGADYTEYTFNGTEWELYVR